jgi:hypothetical protein
VGRLLGELAADGGALFLVLGLALLFYRALWFSGEIASDPVLMRTVYPARQFIAEELRDGRLALWNPYLFTGVPFLADPESGALYPGSLTLRWLDAPQAVTLSVTAHTVLAALGMLVLLRGAFRLGRPAALTGGIVFAFGGFLGANAIEPRVVEASAWMPWVLTAAHLAYRRWLLGGIALGGLMLGVQALAGDLHISALTIAAAVVLLLIASAADVAAGGPGRWLGARGLPVVRAVLVAVGLPLLGAAFAAPQLLPAWELLQRSARANGLPYEALVAGSLRPHELLRVLLPGFNEDPPRRLIAHSGIIALGLAAVALRRPGRAAAFGLGMALLGLLIALGDHTPLPPELYTATSRWALFDHPTRALVMVSLGMAVLAAAGLDRLDRGVAPHRPWVRDRRWRWVLRSGVAAGGLGVVVLVWAWMGDVSLPSRGVREIWFGLGVMAVDIAILLPLLRPRRWVAALLLVAVSAELVVAGARLPFTRTAPPAVFDVNAAVAESVRGREAPERVARLAGVAEQDQAPTPGFERYLPERAGRDRLAPNAALLDGVATLEGLRSALLPPRAVLEALGTPEALSRSAAARGDLPEAAGALAGEMADRLGPRLGATHVLGPARRPLEVGKLAFVLDEGLEVSPSGHMRLDLEGAQAGTGVAMLTELTAPVPAGQPVAALEVIEVGGTVRLRTLVAGVDTGTGPGQTGDRPVELGNGRMATLSEQPLGHAARFRAMVVRNLLAEGTLRIHAISLVDDRRGASTPLRLHETLRPVAGAALSVYEDLRTPPRAALVRAVAINPDSGAVRRALATLPPEVVVLDRPPIHDPSLDPTVPSGLDHVRITGYRPERVDVLVTAAAPAILVLRDTAYPGWQARVDGVPVPLLLADGLFRAVEVPEGTHTVVFEFRPRSLERGLWIGVGAAVVAVVLILGTLPWLWAGRRFDTPGKPALD